ncbi:MAG TPA: hypothetical protein VFB58_17165 [Chloroflexota bacterium]|nr:hypothetical protein [Chloroflexota bacterium]
MRQSVKLSQQFGQNTLAVLVLLPFVALTFLGQAAACGFWALLTRRGFDPFDTEA